MTEKVITITYTFDKYGNPQGVGVNHNGDNVLVEDNGYLQEFVRCVIEQDAANQDNHNDDSVSSPCSGLKLVKK